MSNLQSSANPIADLDRISYPGQAPTLRQFRPGYDWAMNSLPELNLYDDNLDDNIKVARTVLSELGRELRTADWVNKEIVPGKFERTIIAIQTPYVGESGGLREGAEIIVAQWGTGFSSPVHGHAIGLMHEQLLHGKIRVNTYRLVDEESGTVRPVKTVIIQKDRTNGVFVHSYAEPSENNRFKRQTLIHNFTALESSASLHFLPEHVRDSRDNTFKVEYFEDVNHLTFKDVFPIDTKQAMYLQKGDVVLVRSSNVPDYGDHYIVVTGPVVEKPWGRRVQDEVIQAPHATILDFYAENDYDGVTLLQLFPDTAKRFREFHGITIVNGEVTFPTV